MTITCHHFKKVEMAIAKKTDNLNSSEILMLFHVNLAMLDIYKYSIQYASVNIYMDALSICVIA